MIPLFISLSIRNLIKNKRNTLSIAIGLFIALSLISAINFNINNSRTELILQSSNIDFSLHAAFSKPNSGFKNFLNDTETWKKIASESEVSSVVPYTTGYRTYLNQSSDFYYDYYIYGVQPLYLDFLHNLTKLNIYSGSINLTNAEYANNTIPVIGVRTDFLQYLASSYIIVNGSVLTELKVIGWITLDPSNTIFSSLNFNVVSNYFQNLVFITYLSFVDERIADQGSLQINIDKHYINLNDLSQTNSNFTDLAQELNNKYPNYIFSNNIPNSLSQANTLVTDFELINFLFLLPFLFISFYISYLASQLNLESRRIQYGIFLSRGGKPSTIYRSFQSEGIIIGGLTGLLVYFLTPIFDYILQYWPFSVDSSNTFSNLAFIFDINQLYQLLIMVLLGSLFGFIIMSIPKYYATLNPKELLQTHRIEESEPEVKTSRDIILFLVGISPFLSIIGLVLAVSLQLPISITSVIIIINILTLLIIPFSPFLITYGMASYLSKQEILLKLFINFYATIIPELKEIIERFILSKKRNLIKIVFIIALCFIFIIVPLITSITLQNYNTQIKSFQIGSDMSIDNYNPSLINESILHTLPTIESITTVQTEQHQSIYIFYINVTSYIQTVHIQSYWNLSINSLNRLDNSSILVTNTFLNTSNAKIGEFFSLDGKNYNIIGTFGALGGTDYYNRNTPMILSNTKPNQNVISHSRILIKFKNLENQTAINNTISYILTLDPNIKVMTNLNFESSLNQFDFLNFVLNTTDIGSYLLSFNVIITLFILMVLRFKERSREIGHLRSRGLDQNQLKKLIIAETFIISTFGLIIGLICGSIIMFIIYNFLSSGFNAVNVIPFDFVLPLNLIFILIMYIISSLILSLLLIKWISNIKVSEQLRFENYMR